MEKEKWQEMFNEASEEVRQWRQEHPRASLTEIENRVDEGLARVRSRMVQEVALASEQTDLRGVAAEKRPRCPGCGRPTMANGRQKRRLISRHEQVLELERSKAFCRACRVSFFPPG